MSLTKKIETINFQIDTFASGHINLEDLAHRIKCEWVMVENTEEVVNERKRKQLYKVFHSTRAFDTGLKMFLEKFGKGSNSHSISEYVRDLQHHATGFHQLSGTIATYIQNEITNKRNIYCHASGMFPNKNEADYIINRILHYYTLVLGLEK